MWKWIWDNISNIDATVSTITAICSGVVFVVVRLKIRHTQLKCLNLDKRTRQSMKYYISTRVQNSDPCDKEYVDNNSSFALIPFFMKAFKSSESQYFIILADSGMGKTTFLLKLYFKYRRKIFKKYHIILLSLSQKQTLEAIKKVRNKQKTILLLDSFDEDPYAMENYVNRLDEICNETEMFYKVVMTCRTQFFPDSKNEPKITGKMKFGVGKKNIEFEKYYILPFTDSEITIYLKKKYNKFFEKEKLERSLRLISNCPQLMVRPMLLSNIDDLVLDNKKEYNNAYEIYSQLVSKWIEREALKDNKLLYEFSEKIAEYMYNNKTIYIEGKEVENFCKKYNIKLKGIEARSRSLLNRNANGAYKFAHKSILEYFLFEKAWNNPEFRKTVIWNGLNGYEMLECFMKEKCFAFLHDLLRDNPIELKSGLFKYFILPQIDLSGLNIINCDFEGSILFKANFTATKFVNVDFKGSFLEKAKFVGAELRDTKLNYTFLRKCEFRNAYFDNSDLEGADLEGARLEGASLKWSNLRETNLSKASLSGADLYRADLVGTDLREATLIETNFEGASLRGVDFSKSYLLYSKSSELLGYEKSIFDMYFDNDQQKGMCGADLSEANLVGINLSETILDNSILNDTIIDEMQIYYLEDKFDLRNVKVYLNKSHNIISYKEYKYRKK